MKDLRLQQLLQRFKKKLKKEYLEYSNNYIFDNAVISLSEELPNNLLFNLNEDNYPKQILKYNRIVTNEKFYKNGILGNVYDLHQSSYNWLFGLCIFKQYYHIFGNNIKCFYMGFDKNDFHKGAKYFLDKINDVKIEWLGMDINQSENQEQIIHGFVSDDLLNANNIIHTKTIVDNKFGKINLLVNFISPKKKQRKILLSAAILTISNLSHNGIFITRILSPENWDDCFIDYILLFSMIFKDTEICRYPIQRKNYVEYRYYLICFGRNKILYNSLIYRRLVMLLKNKKHLRFLPMINEMPEVKLWKEKILELQKKYISSTDNPQLDTNEIINKLQDIFNLEGSLVED